MVEVEVIGSTWTSLTEDALGRSPMATSKPQTTSQMLPAKQQRIVHLALAVPPRISQQIASALFFFLQPNNLSPDSREK